METKLNFSEAWRTCPRAKFCNINKCILYPDYDKLQNDPNDPALIEKKKCIPKSIRIRIAKQFNLSNGGLTSRERRAKELWDSLPSSEKQARIEKIKKMSLITRLSDKGYVIAPKKKNVSDTHIQINKNSPRTGINNNPLGILEVHNGE